jgi:hypothetical protein
VEKEERTTKLEKPSELTTPVIKEEKLKVVIALFVLIII